MNRKSITYLLIMVAGSSLFIWFTEENFNAGGVLGFLIFAGLVALVTKGIKTLYQKFIRKNDTIDEESNGFWFEFIEDTFAWWLIILAMLFISRIFN